MTERGWNTEQPKGKLTTHITQNIPETYSLQV